MGKKKQCQISFSWAPKSLWMVTAATKLEDACSLEEKLLQTLHSILKSRDITLLTKVHIVKALVFPVVMCGCESWTIRKAEHQRNDAFELWCWRRLESPLDSKEIKPVNSKANQSWNSLEGLMLKLKLHTLATWCEEPTHCKRPWCRGRLRARGEGGNRGWDGWMASLTQWTWVWVNSKR